MAVSPIPKSGITLHGTSNSTESPASAVVLRISDGILRDIKEAAKSKDDLHMLTGNTPKLRIGNRTIDLTLSPDAFRHELYASTIAGSLADLKLAGLLTHRVELKSSGKRYEEDGIGSDAALAALQSTMASLEQEKLANQTNITRAVLPQKGRLDGSRKNRKSLAISAQPFSPSLNAGAAPPTPTSVPLNDSAARMQAVRVPVLHLLAIKPIPYEDISSATHLPKDDLDNILQKTARQEDGQWKLTDRAYKDLDVWKFEYRSPEDRRSAIENAIKAYDRLRIGKDEPIWQLLLKKSERGQGIVLSRLNIGGQVNRGLTPSHATSPLPHVDGPSDSRPASTVNTPRIGASTPRSAAPKGDIMKRLLSKNPKKAQAVEDAKEKKRKEKEVAREVAISDRDGTRGTKRQVIKKVNPKVKSAELVHSSDESGEEGEVKDALTRTDSKVSPEKPKLTTGKPKARASEAPLSNSEARNRPSKVVNKATAKAQDPPYPAASPSLKSTKATAGVRTPSTANGLAAPSSQSKSQLSPQKSDSKPTIPSPLGAARPRVASDVSDRNAVGVQRMRQGADTPRGLGITNGVRKRQDTVTSTESFVSSGSDKKRPDVTSQKDHKPAVNGVHTPKPPPTNGIGHKAEQGTKRKADDSSRQNAPAMKHRKTESTSSQSHQSHASTNATAQSTARTSPDVTFDSASSDSAGSVLDSITYLQGVNMAEKFREQYYPAYAKMYDDQAAREAMGETISRDERERLWAMHRRLDQIKREIRIAAQREHRDD